MDATCRIKISVIIKERKRQISTSINQSMKQGGLEKGEGVTEGGGGGAYLLSY